MKTVKTSVKNFPIFYSFVSYSICLSFVNQVLSYDVEDVVAKFCFLLQLTCYAESHVTHLNFSGKVLEVFRNFSTFEKPVTIVRYSMIIS